MTDKTIIGNGYYCYEDVLAAVSAITDTLSNLDGVRMAVRSFIGEFSDIGDELDFKACQLFNDSLKLLTRMIEPHYSSDPFGDVDDESWRFSLLALREFAEIQLAFHLELTSQVTRALATEGLADCNADLCLGKLTRSIRDLACISAKVNSSLRNVDNEADVNEATKSPTPVEL